MPFFNANLQSFGVDLESIYVDSSALLAFEKGMTAQSQEDVVSFLLLSFLAASKQYSAFNQPEDWLNKLQEIMRQIGFITTGATWDRTEASSDTTLSKLALDRIHGDEHSAVEQAIEAVGKSQNERALRILSSAAGDRQRTAFLTGLTVDDGNNNSIIVLYAFFGKISKPNDNVLESGFKKGDELQYVRIDAVLSDFIARNLRGSVKQKIDQYYEANVAPVEF